jgi:hypothetical protein
VEFGWLSWDLLGETENKDDLRHCSRYPRRHLNPAPPEDEAGARATLPRA